MTQAQVIDSAADNSLKPISHKDHVVIMGLGKSGLSAALFCRSLGARVSVSEFSPIDKLDGDICDKLKKSGAFLETGGHSLELFLSADLVIVSPGVPLTNPVLVEVRKKQIPVVGEMSLAAIYLRTPMLAITGTNGKTTVTTLLGEIFEAAGKSVFVGGNIGTPLTDYLAGPQDKDAVILEISSFQLDSAVAFRPDVALLLNISADHLDRYESFAEYAKSKFSIFKNQQDGDVAIINAEDPGCNEYLENNISLGHGWAERSSLSFGRDIGSRKGAVLLDQKVKLIMPGRSGDGEIFDLSGTKMSTSPNLENSMAAILAAISMGCSPAGIRKGLANFEPLPHRLSLVAESKGVKYLDDSKATNVGAVVVALESMNRPVILIAGGREKGCDFSSMRKVIQAKVKNLLLIGEAREKMAAVFAGLTQVETLDSMESAVARAHQLGLPGDVVLLSPACASFDMFKSYADRGRVFARLVRELVC